MRNEGKEHMKIVKVFCYYALRVFNVDFGCKRRTDLLQNEIRKLNILATDLRFYLEDKIN